MNTFEVVFQPDSIRIAVKEGTLLTNAMKQAGLAIQLPCGGTGKCGKCVVEIQPDAPPAGDFDRQYITDDDLARGKRLACKTRVDRPMRVFLSDTIRAAEGQILVNGLDRTVSIDTPLKKTYLDVPPPSLEDQRADLQRVAETLGIYNGSCPDIDIRLARELPDILRNANFRITVTSENSRIVAVEPGDTTSRLYGIAFDIGTTTVVGSILDLRNGGQEAYASRLNAQIIHGEDTISRIKYAIEEPNGLSELRSKILGVINEIIDEAVEKAGIEKHEIYEAVFVGNTTMSHLLMGMSPEGLSKIPFVPVTNTPLTTLAKDAGIGINPLGTVHVLPNIAGFVGSDTVAVMLACDYLDDGPTQLAVDVGTNGELALRHDGKLTVCSTAAGPALEGAALTCGMRAAPGAIEHVTLTENDVECDIIGNVAPAGICGSGIIDIVAELVRTGIVDSVGRVLPPEECPRAVSEELKSRIVENEGGEYEFVLAVDESGDVPRRIVISQRDIRQIQLAKGAISAGIALLVKSAGLTLDDLDEILLAGAFGNYIRAESAQRMGLLPMVPVERIRFVGNAASAGAKMALLSRSARADADRIRHVTGHIELASMTEFMTEFSNSMLFP